MHEALTTTDLPLPNKRTGKVRDLYDLTLPDGSEGILIIATDRVSVFDVVLGNGIPGKGVLLTRISSFWFEFFADDCPHHLVSTDPADIEGLDASQRNTHGSPALRTHLVINRVCNRNSQGPGIAQIRAADHQRQAVNEVKTIHIVDEFYAEDAAMMLEQPG